MNSSPVQAIVAECGSSAGRDQPLLQDVFLRRRDSRLPFIQLACVLWSALILAIPSETFLVPPAEVVVWVTAGVLVLFCVYGLSVAGRQGDNRWIAPVYLLMALYALLFGWGALVAYYWGLVPWEVYPALRNVFYAHGAWSHLPAACRLVLLGAVGLFLGVTLPAEYLVEYLPALRWRVDQAKLKARMVICAPILLLGYWFIQPHLPHALEFLVFLIASTTDGVFIIGSYYLNIAQSGVERLKWSAFLVMLYAAALPSAMLTGQMVPLLMPAVLIACGYVLARGSLPWLWMAVSVPLALWVVLPFTALYKLSTAEAPQMGDRMFLASERFSKTSYRAKLELALARTVARFSVIQAPAVFLQFYPSVYPFEVGRTFGIELTGLVPRVLWPDKPEVSPLLNQYSEDVGLTRKESGTSMVFDAISEYYVNFGAAGVLVLSVLHGWYIGFLYEWLVRQSNYLIGGSLYLSLMFGNWGFFGLANIFEAHTRTVLVWIVIYYLLSSGAGRGRR